MSAALVAGLVVGVAVGDAGAATPAACAPTAVFETDGYTAGESLVNWNNSAFNANPPAGWEIVQVPYYAGVFPVVDRKGLDDSVAEGTGKLERAVHAYHAACPGSRLVLAGYSEGAVVAGDVIERFAQSSAIPHGQLFGALYGNPRRPFGDGGIGGVAGGIETNVPTILPGVTMKGGQNLRRHRRPQRLQRERRDLQLHQHDHQPGGVRQRHGRLCRRRPRLRTRPGA
ncbi:cutinase family protein [Actinophytocola sp.]|uniref:cutinase family protein n=1 Tax=Actinophytocola sp. TaxID=1872138 RepID=UPI003D6A2971